MKKISLLLFILIFVSSCGAFVHPKDQFDVSNKEPFRSIIGKQFETINPVYLVEHNDDPNKNVIRFYGLQAIGPMHKTRFINNQYPLPLGQKFIVVKVTKYSRWFDFSGGVDVIAKMTGGDFNDLVVVISLIRGNEGGGQDIFNPKYYRQIKND